MGPSESRAELRDQLGRILSSSFFSRSERMSRFLRFAVEQTLAGNSDQLKEYVIGVEVFDRGRDYDPRVDPIVRVEARRLRSKLKDYYAGAGKTDSLIIEFPTGSYTPLFHSRKAAVQVEGRRELPKSVAVLPFTNLTPGTGDEYFSDGLTEELIHLLTRIEGLRVVAWHSASLLRGRDQDLNAIREQLRSDAVLRGAIRRTETRVRVTAQLIDTVSGSVLWSDAYDREMSGVFSIQEEIARAIVTTLRVALSPDAATVPALPTASSVECYNLCLRGRYQANRRTQDGLINSAALFAEAVKADAGCAMAYAGLADAYSLLSDYGLMAPKEVMPKAEAAALRALEIEPDSGDAMASLAFIRSGYHWRWTEAEALYRRAIQLTPGNAKARHWFATDFLVLLGRFEEGLQEIEIARELNPLSMIVHEGHAYLHMLRRDYPTALATLEQIIEMEPGFSKAHGSRGRTLSLMGRYSEAIAAFEMARAIGGDSPTVIAALGQTQALRGNRAAALASLEELDRMAERRYVPAASRSVVYLGLGEHDKCMDWLEIATEAREFPACGIYMHPLYDPLRNEPRFKRLLQRASFPAVPRLTVRPAKS